MTLSVMLLKTVTDNELLAAGQLYGVPRVGVIEMLGQQDVTDVLAACSELFEFVPARHEHVVTDVH